MLLSIAPSYIDLLTELQGVADWKKLAAYLLDDVSGNIVPVINQTNLGDVDGCRDDMIRQFMKSGDVTWMKVIESLQKAGYTNLAKSIQEKKSGDPSRPSSKG